MIAQLELFSAPARPARVDEWFSRVLPDRAGVSAYVIMIRDADDPAPPPKAALHCDRDKAPHLTLRTQSVETWRDAFRLLVNDGAARTFNAMCVTIAGLTADICAGEVPEAALWSLVEEGSVAFTMAAPILFRKC